MSVSVPKRPRDQQRIDWWWIQDSKLYHSYAIYHVNTPWKKVCPRRGAHGADLVRTWQVFSHGHFSGRSDGDFLRMVLAGDGIFHTERVGLSKLIGKLGHDIARFHEASNTARRARVDAERRLKELRADPRRKERT